MEKLGIPSPLFLYFTFSLFYMEFLLGFHTSKSFSLTGILLSFVFTCSFATLFLLLSSLFNKQINYILSILLLFISAMIYMSQFLYYQFFKTFYSLFSVINAGQITDFRQDIFGAIIRHFFILFLIFLPVLIIAFFGKKWFSYKKFTGLPILVSLSFICSCYLFALIIIHQTERIPNSAFDLYYHSNLPTISVEKLGLFTTMRLDLQRLLTGWSPTPTYAEPIDPPSRPIGPTNKENGEKALTEEDPPSAQVLNIDFESMFQEERDPVVKDMHQYFANVPPTNKNSFTGKFKGYNLIFITAEGFSSYAVQKDVTPTLYKMVHEGFQFPNFYNPIWGVSTSDGEYVATTSLLPKPGVWSFYQSSKNDLPFVMGNQLKKLNYKTVAYHNHTYDYYRRDLSHPNMGYDYKGVGNGLDIKETWPESDLEMMEVTIPEYIHDEPFHAYYMTVSGHMQYSFTGNYIAYKNKQYVEDLPLSEQAKAYLATQIELDRALEYLLGELEKAGIADKTLIALSADHYPYGLEKEVIDEFAGHEVEENFELYKSTFILYSKGIDPIVIDKPASSLDIIPTLSNLLGLEYDSRLLMGKDLFSDANPLVIFQNKSFITDKGRYNSITNTFTPVEDVDVDEKYVKNMSAIVHNKFYYSTKILDTNYYSKIQFDH